MLVLVLLLLRSAGVRILHELDGPNARLVGVEIVHPSAAVGQSVESEIPGLAHEVELLQIDRREGEGAASLNLVCGVRDTK